MRPGRPPTGSARGDQQLALARSLAQVLRSTAPGELVSYGELAVLAGFPGAARAVGNALRGSSGLPWWRVVTASGRLVPGLEERQSRLLAEEGIVIEVGARSVSRSALRACGPRRGSGADGPGASNQR